MQNAEANAFLTRVEQLLPGPGADLDAVLRPSLDDETELRRLFAQDKNNPRLKDPHVGLIDVFGASAAIRTTRARVVADEKDHSAKYIMPLSSAQRRKEGSAAMVANINEFKKNWAIFTEGSLSQLADWSNVVAAGGSIQACLAPLPAKATVSKRALRKHFHSHAYPASDVDLFLYGLTPQQAEAKINTIYEAVRDSVPWDVTCIRTKHTVSIHSQYPYRAVQIVLRLYQSPAEILAGFDVDAPCCAYDGERVWANPRAIVAAMRQCNTTDITRRSPSYEVRLAKYASRDFEVYVPQLRRDDIDPTIFERSIVRVQGLARLIVLEKLATAMSRESYVVSRRNLRGRPQKASPWARSRRTKHYKGDLKDEVNSGLELSDYDVVSLHIPYGPGWDARRIEKLVYQTDLGMNSPFNPKNKGRRLHRHPAFFGTMSECLEDCCEHCPAPKNDEEREQQKEEDESYIRSRVQFIIEDAGRQSISGSFNPIDEGEWTEQAYMGPTEKFFAAIALNDSSAAVKMIQEGMDVNRRDHVGRTPLQVAALSGAVNIAFDLVDAGARMTSRLVDGRTVLHVAAQLNLPTLVRKLLERSAVNAEAAQVAEEEAAQLKAKESMKTEQSDDCESDESDSELRDSSEDDWDSDDGSKVDNEKTEKPKDEDNIPEDETEEPDVFQIDVQDWDYGLSPLHYAIISGSSATLDLLIASGADAKLVAKVPSLYGARYAHSLMLTSVTEDEDEACRIAERLLAAGNVSSEADDNLATVFHRIVCQSKPKLVSTLLVHDPNAKTVMSVPYMPSYGPVVFPLVSTIYTQSYSSLAILLAHGSKIQISDDDLEKARDMRIKANQHVAELSSMKVPTLLEAALTLYDPSIHLLVALGADVNELLSEIQRYRGPSSLTCLDYVRLVLQRISSSKQPLAVPGNITLSLLPNIPEAIPSVLLSRSSARDKVILALESEQPTWRIEVQRIIASCKDVMSKHTPSSNGSLYVEEIDKYFSEVQTLLLAHGAKTAREILPEDALNNSDPFLGLHHFVPHIPTQYHYIPTIHTFSGYNIRFYRHVGPGGHSTIATSLDSLYNELFTACYEGNNVRIQQLCTPHPNRKAPDTPLQISVHWGNASQGFTPLSLAVLSRKWDTVKLILAIAISQYSPKEPTERVYESRITSLGDDDSDGGESGEDVEMDYEEEPMNFTDIAKRPSEIRVQVPPSRIMGIQVPWLNRAKNEAIWSGLVEKAIVEDDFEAFIQILGITSSLPHEIIGAGILHHLIVNDRPAMLDEYIRRTGQGINIPNPAQGLQDPESFETSSKVYLGLNVHGKKRKDLATKGDPNAPQAYTSTTIPIVWNAIKNGSTAVVRYLASDQPLAAYRFYASSHSDQKAKLLRQIPDIEATLPAMLGWTANALNETPLTAAIISNRADMVEMLVSLRANDMQNYLQLRQRTHGFNNILAAVRWAHDPAVFDILLAKGVSPMETDSDKRNIYHVLCACPQEESWFKLLEYVLDKLPKDVTHTLLRQQIKSTGDTPLHVAIKKPNWRAVKALTATGVDQYLIRDSTGFVPLHAAVNRGHPEITRLVAEAGAAMALTLEDGIGSTPLEIATHRAFEAKISPAIEVSISRNNHLSPNWHLKPFRLATQEAELARFRATLGALVSEGRLSQGTKLWKELVAFADLLEQKITVEKTRCGGDEEENHSGFMGDTSATLRVLKLAIEARPGSRGLVHLADVHLSVNKGLEQYTDVKEVTHKDDDDEEPDDEVPQPVLTSDYETYLNTSIF